MENGEREIPEIQIHVKSVRVHEGAEEMENIEAIPATAKIRLGMRTLGLYAGSAPRVLEVVLQMEDTKEAIEKMISSTYASYYPHEVDHMVRATVSGSSLQLDDYLIARLPDGEIRVVPVSRPEPDTGIAEELKKLEASLSKQVIVVNNLEISEARIKYTLAKEDTETAVVRILKMIERVIGEKRDLPPELVDLWTSYCRYRDVAIELRTAIPEARYATVTNSGLPVPRPEREYASKDEPATAQ